MGNNACCNGARPTAHLLEIASKPSSASTATHCTQYMRERGRHANPLHAFCTLANPRSTLIRGPLGGQSIHSSWSEFNAISKTASRSRPLVSRYLTHSQDAPRPHTNYNVAPQECCRPPFPCCKDFGKGRTIAPHILIAKRTHMSINHRKMYRPTSACPRLKALVLKVPTSGTFNFPNNARRRLNALLAVMSAKGLLPTGSCPKKRHNT